MNRIDICFKNLKESGKKAMIPFFTAGDPSLKDTEKLILAAIEGGADMIQLGVPFSDPVAELPPVQAASLRALERGVKVSQVLELVKSLREKTQTPIVLMMYANTIYRQSRIKGEESFFAKASAAGADGVIVADAPYEEREEFLGAASEAGMYLINVVTPTSKERMKEIAGEAKGFLYCMAFDPSTYETFLKSVKTMTPEGLPCCIGGGLATPEDFKIVKDYCEGVVAASAFVEKAGEGEGAAKALAQTLKGVL